MPAAGPAPLPVTGGGGGGGGGNLPPPKDGLGPAGARVGLGGKRKRVEKESEEMPGKKRHAEV